MNIVIKQLNPELIDDFLHYFDDVAFTDNPEWSRCYCLFHHFPGSIKNWMKRTAEENRADSANLVLSGVINGFLAYHEEKPIGWINVDFKRSYLRVPYKKDVKPIKDKNIASIVCILIAPSYRKKGVAKQLLHETLIKLKEKGIKWVEAYPRIGDLSDAHQYHGPLSLYKSEAFLVVKELKNMVVVQRWL